VINAGTKEKDIEYIRSVLPSGLQLAIYNEKSLIAIQGSCAEQILQKYVAVDLSGLKYMYGTKSRLLDKYEVLVTRTGYTGEDGFEISVENSVAPQIWQKLLENPEVKAIGLGARDSLRLEMGYPLYGHDINEDTTPIEASIGWVVTKDHKKFTADQIILNQKSMGAPRKRIGLKLFDKIVAREGAEIYKDSRLIGKVTSGGFSPTLNQPICMGLVSSANAVENIELDVKVRDKFYKAQTVKMPFLEARTKK
jgi:aminomethyltransferase